MTPKVAWSSICERVSGIPDQLMRIIVIDRIVVTFAAVLSLLQSASTDYSAVDQSTAVVVVAIAVAADRSTTVVAAIGDPEFGTLLFEFGT